MELETYLEALASEAPTPGGGSAATVVAAMAAALVAMVARITRKNVSYAAKAADADAVIAAADALREELLTARNVDEAAYTAVVRAMALPKATPGEKLLRSAELQAALEGAATAPMHAAGLSLRVLFLARDARELGNKHLMSDVDCASAFARAAIEAGAANVRVNHAYLRDADAFIASQEAELLAIETAAAEMRA